MTSMANSPIAVLGAGNWGTTLAHLAARSAMDKLVEKIVARYSP